MEQFFKLSITTFFLGILLFPGFSNAETIDVQVAASADDASERVYYGTMEPVEISTRIQAHVSYYRYWSGSRFAGISIPRGSTINVAYVTAYVWSTTYDDADATIYFEKAASPASFTADGYNMSSRTKTTSSVSWIESSTGGGWRNTPSLVAPLQEVVDAFTPTALVLIVAGNTFTSNTGRMNWYSWDNTTTPANTYGAKLHIEYTVLLDTAPPVRSAGQPSGALAAGTTQTTLSLATDENATCKYGDVAGTSYDLMPNTFSTTGGMSHSTIVTGLTNGTSYTYYVRCQDTAVPPHQNADDSFYITFSVAEPTPPDTTPPVISGVQASSITTSTAVFTWTTDDLSTSIVNYGLAASFGQTQSDSSLVTSHSVNLTGLASTTTYYYQVRSCNSDNYCADSATYNFTTLSPPSTDSTVAGAMSLVPTIENIGVTISYTNDNNQNNNAILEYRQVGAVTWKTAPQMWASRTNRQYKGSIFWLTTNTQYEVRVTFVDAIDGVSGTNPVIATVTTRNDNPPSNGNSYYVDPVGDDNNAGTEASPWLTIGKAALTVNAGDTVYIKPGVSAQAVTLSRSGTATNYITFRNYGTSEVILDANQGFNNLFNVTGNYIRIKGLKLRNTLLSAIRISGSDNIVEDSDILDPDWSGGSSEGGIRLSEATSRDLIQRNTITLTNGPASVRGGTLEDKNGIAWWMSNSSGGHVIRDNIVQSNTGRMWDGIGGGPESYSMPVSNSDFYNNTIRGASDDGIQVEGGDINTRIYNNRIENSFLGIAFAGVRVGPLYVFRNVIVNTSVGTDGTGEFKMGVSSTGRVYLYHNTYYTNQANGVGLEQTNAGLQNIVSRNNAVYAGKYAIETYSGISGFDFDYDNLYTTDSSKFVKWNNTQYTGLSALRTATGQELNGISSDSQFVNPSAGDLILQSTSPNIDKGVILLNFNDANSPWAYKGSAPDMGAYEYDSGAPPPPSSFTVSNTNQLYLFREKTNTFSVSGSNFNLSANFSIQFLQNSSVVSSFTSQPTNSTTLSLSLTSAQVNTLPIGLYDLKVVRTTDNSSQTYTKQILITALGDLWSSTATEGAEQKRDGKVNLYDVSRMLSKWGSIVAADLQECDINAGPSNVSQGKIDLFDANKIMANWLP